MSTINTIFEKIEKLTGEEGQQDFISASFAVQGPPSSPQTQPSVGSFELQKAFIQKICFEIDNLSHIVKNDDTILISVKHQKLLRTCFQLIGSIGISTCLIPGLGISLTKRCVSASILPDIKMKDEEKYEMLVLCTDFFQRSYTIPVLKKIILTFHLSDYLAALIQLSFAPLKKPGTYGEFIMTLEMFTKLTEDRQKYIQIYEDLVGNCFQPILMKELMVLQGPKNAKTPPPAFAKRVIAKEMSQRLLAPGGLLSLIRCFIESYGVDTGFEWDKINMICKIVSTKHGNDVDKYLNNICAQLMKILSLKNTYYLSTATACVLSLNGIYPQSEPVKKLVTEVFQAFDVEYLVSKSNLPGVVLLSSQEIELKINALHACLCTSRFDCRPALLIPNMYVLFMIGMECSKSDELKMKIIDILLNCIEQLTWTQTKNITKMLLFGRTDLTSNVVVTEYDSGLIVKQVATPEQYPRSKALIYFTTLIKSSPNPALVKTVFEVALELVFIITSERDNTSNKDLMELEDEPNIISNADEMYANILQFLSEISTSPKVITALKEEPDLVLNFIEHFLKKNHTNPNEDSVSIALILLNIILSNSDIPKYVEQKLSSIIPVLKKMSQNESSYSHILCKEALNLIGSGSSNHVETPYSLAVADALDDLLPVQAHGVMELTKLIDSKDPETMSKKHYIFCIFQEQLKSTDSYLYLAAINGLASLAAHCTEDVLQVLCNEYLSDCGPDSFSNEEMQEKSAQDKMKVGDVIVKVTRKLGELGVVHRALLVTSVLEMCRDPDPLLRASALSNLAELCLVLHYKLGTIIYEVLLCIWTIVEGDKAIECRRAAVMAVASLLKGLGQETLIQLQESLLPIYRSLRRLYNDPEEDDIVRLHAQLALEELNHIVKQFLTTATKEREITLNVDKPDIKFK